MAGMQRAQLRGAAPAMHAPSPARLMRAGLPAPQRRVARPAPVCATTSDRKQEEGEASSSQPAADSRDSSANEEAKLAELRELAGQRRAAAKEANPGLIEGLLQETRLISWPTPLQAIKETFTVVAIVVVSAVLLFGLNAVLTEGAELLYSLKRR